MKNKKSNKMVFAILGVIVAILITIVIFLIIKINKNNAIMPVEKSNNKITNNANIDDSNISDNNGIIDSNSNNSTIDLKTSSITTNNASTNKNKSQNPIATINVDNYGTIKVELYPNIAPNTVKNFIALANNGFYDGLTFHRVIKNFMIQGGDNNGDGTGSPSLSDLDSNISKEQDKQYSIKGEFKANGYNNSLKHTEGVISMARADYSTYGKTEEGYNSAGSQFFIVTKTAPSLDGLYTSFGKVKEGMEIVHKIENTSTNNDDSPTEKVIINSIRVDTLGKNYELPETLDVFDIYSYLNINN